MKTYAQFADLDICTNIVSNSEYLIKKLYFQLQLILKFISHETQFLKFFGTSNTVIHIAEENTQVNLVNKASKNKHSVT